jgi:hypothetical protein
MRVRERRKDGLALVNTSTVVILIIPALTVVW